jgi:Reverse transcriptase (RNA-dependent DNA polymerase)
LFSFDPSKAPGPDDFFFYFYQECWDLISNDFMQLEHAFYNNELDLARINLTYICLIPKKVDAQTITQFRPISLISCNIKIITKLLTERLSKIMDTHISYIQTAYINGKYIMNNMVCAHEALNSIKNIFFICPI